MKCKNCGAEYSNKLVKCPYCGTMNRKAAYKDFKKKVDQIIDRLFGLKTEAYDSVSKMIFISILRSLLIIAICLAIGFGLAMLQNVNYYHDEKEDTVRYENIIWENENLAVLNEAYANRDFATIKKLLDQNYRVVSSWEHYPSYVLQTECEDILNEEYFNEYVLRDILYYLFDPDMIVYGPGMSEEELKIYEADRARILAVAEEHGFNEQELKEIHQAHKDNYGFITSADLSQYIKED